MLTDTVMVGKFVGGLTDRPSGWFASFADLGAAGSLSFFNVRNNSIGTMYNNQDARDQLPYGFRIQSIGIRFWSSTASTFTVCYNLGDTELQREAKAETDYTDPLFTDMVNREELHAAVWEGDLPNHASAMLKTNQDIRLKAPVTMLASGTGPIGGGWGWGSPNDLIYYANGGSVVPAIAGETTPPHLGAFCGNLEDMQVGEVDIRQRFPFPVPIDVPKRANLSLEIKLSQYARELLQTIPGPYWWPVPNAFTINGLTKSTKAAVYGIECTLLGERQVQQRGDYAV
jgi:hypothetical protein